MWRYKGGQLSLPSTPRGWARRSEERPGAEASQEPPKHPTCRCRPALASRPWHCEPSAKLRSTFSRKKAERGDMAVTTLHRAWEIVLWSLHCCWLLQFGRTRLGRQELQQNEAESPSADGGRGRRELKAILGTDTSAQNTRFYVEKLADYNSCGKRRAMSRGLLREMRPATLTSLRWSSEEKPKLIRAPCHTSAISLQVWKVTEKNTRESSLRTAGSQACILNIPL